MNELLPSATFDHCLDCGTALRGGATFCSRCGQRVGEQTSARAAIPSEAPLDVDRSPAWVGLKPALQLFGSLLACSFGGMVAYKFSSSPWIDVAVCALDAVLVAGFLLRDLHALRPVFGRPSRLPFAHTLLVVCGAGLFLSLYFAALEAVGTPFVRVTDDIVAAGWPISTAYLLVAVYPAVFEEVAFRGIILNRLELSIGMSEALLVQAAMFSVLHLMPMIFPSHFLMGLVFGWLRRRSGSLYPGMLAHAAWNAWVVWQETG